MTSRHGIGVSLASACVIWNGVFQAWEKRFTHPWATDDATNGVRLGAGMEEMKP